MQIDTSELVEQLTRAGVGTHRAGFDPKRRQVWIQFSSSEDATTLLNLMARYIPEGEDLHRRIFGGGREPRAWQYSVAPVNQSREEIAAVPDELNWRPPTRYSFVLYSLFPPEDLPILIGLLRDYNGSLDQRTPPAPL
ncbi:MAG TPA: hypothetical protein VM534_04190 [Thermoanaerobaculia bacterium]|nr:hypothetical protein [Thermoanaerobaculia bacterium]